MELKPNPNYNTFLIWFLICLEGYEIALLASVLYFTVVDSDIRIVRHYCQSMERTQGLLYVDFTHPQSTWLLQSVHVIVIWIINTVGILYDLFQCYVRFWM